MFDSVLRAKIKFSPKGKKWRCHRTSKSCQSILQAWRRIQWFPINFLTPELLFSLVLFYIQMLKYRCREVSKQRFGLSNWLNLFWVRFWPLQTTFNLQFSTYLIFRVVDMLHHPAFTKLHLVNSCYVTIFSPCWWTAVQVQRQMYLNIVVVFLVFYWKAVSPFVMSYHEPMQVNGWLNVVYLHWML